MIGIYLDAIKDKTEEEMPLLKKRVHIYHHEITPDILKRNTFSTPCLIFTVPEIKGFKWVSGGHQEARLVVSALFLVKHARLQGKNGRAEDLALELVGQFTALLKKQNWGTSGALPLEKEPQIKNAFPPKEMGVLGWLVRFEQPLRFSRPTLYEQPQQAFLTGDTAHV